MTKLEKVLKDLGTLIDYWDDVDRFEEHVYGANILNTLTDARTWIEDTLKEREPRVLTLKEVLSQSWDYCYIEAEVRPRSKMIETLCGTHRLYCTTSIVLERQTRGDKEYGKTWRCWTARPTDEQRKATPWDEPPKEGEIL